MFIKQFFPKVVETKQSPINGEITVYKMLKNYSISVDNLTQSGGLVSSVWKKTTNYLDHHHFTSPPKKLLFLGLSAGASLPHIYAKWPKAKITGLEIDPIMIKLGEKYFGLKSYNQLKIEIQDAFEWLHDHRQAYDVVYVDMYIGRDVPFQATTRSFLQKIKFHLNENGVAVFNRLKLKNQSGSLKDFDKDLRYIFHDVRVIPTPVNRVFMARDLQSEKESQDN